MNILAIDVSITGCSVAIFNQDSNLSLSKFFDTDRGQAEILIPMLDDIVRKAHLQMSDIDLIAVTRGPGSFTGVRIGLATARSLGLALNIPVIGISTLDVIARAHGDKSALFLIDTKRGDFYGQVGESGEASIWHESEVVLFKGSIVKDVMPDILVLAQTAAEIYQGQKGYDIAATPKPIYLREAEVSEAKKPSLYTINL
jgi:tRNA threonylcarbamoyl adenosine modification protein YeaZ